MFLKSPTGVGIDDTFVLIAAWRRTNTKDSVQKRMANCYAEASVSITITSVTDLLSFVVGTLTPMPCVQIFCAYSATCILCTYIFQITFIGGILAWSGYREENNMHNVLFWKKAIPKAESSEWNIRIVQFPVFVAHIM